MAKRNVRLAREMLGEARANLTASLEDKSAPVGGKSWVYWQGRAEGLEALLAAIEGRPA